MKFLSKAWFKEDKAGNTVFQPYGLLGSKFIVDEQEVRSRIEKAVNIFFVLFFAIMVGLILAGWEQIQAASVSVLISGLWYWYSISKAVKGLSKSTE